MRTNVIAEMILHVLPFTIANYLVENVPGTTYRRVVEFSFDKKKWRKGWRSESN